MYKNVLEYLEKTAAGAAADRGVSDVDTFMTYPAFVEMARNAGAAMTGLVPAGRPVAVFAEKGVRTLAAMIGVVYSGGFYVSINPEQPAERIARILRVLDPALVIVSEEMKETLLAAGFAGQILDLDATVEHQGTEEEFAALDRVREQSGRDDILYGVFTSGSTGDPKGIIISHGAVIDFIGHFTEIFEIGEKDIIGNQAPFDFDVSVKDIYSAMQDKNIVDMARKVWQETGDLLVKKFGFDPAKHEEYVKTTEKRFRNPHLSDEVTRVARGPKRKLGAKDRLVSPATQLLAQGQKPSALATVIGAAFHFDYDGDKEAQEVQGAIQEKGLHKAILNYTQIPEESELFRMVENKTAGF